MKQRRWSIVARVSRQGSCERTVTCSFERNRAEGYEDTEDEDGTGFQIHKYYGECDGCSICIRRSAEGSPRLTVSEDQDCRSTCPFRSSVMRPIPRSSKAK